MKEIYAADFETNTTEETCKANPVWAWGIKHIFKGESSYRFGNSIESFFDYLKTFKKNAVIYFHNEKFDGQFILYYICRQGFIRTDKKVENTFDTTIDNMLKFYDITIRIKNEKGKLIILSIRDSYKKINMPIYKMPKAYGIKIEKGNLDDSEEESYNTYREKGHKLTEFEKDYLKRDVFILSEALRITYEKGLTKMTMAMDAMSKFKEMIGEQTFDYYFPVLDKEEDTFVRKSYKGGWTFCLKEQEVGAGRVYDVNSLYPSVLYSNINGEKHYYPQGYGVYYKGKYEYDNLRPLYVQHFYCGFRCKPGKLPFIQLHPNLFINTKPVYEYDSNGIVELYLTSVDMELFFETYDVYTTIDYVDGYKYDCVGGIFDSYVDYWLNVKVQAKKDDNKAMYTIAKVYLNSLYGKFGTSKYCSGKYPEYNAETDVIEYKDEIYIDENGNEYISKERDAYYVPVAAFCTSYARGVTLRAADKAYEQGRFCYADTDSVHITGDYGLDGLHVDSNKLGWWDHEKTFIDGIFIRAKTYAEYDGKEWEIKCAGMPDPIKKGLGSKENFKELFKPGFKTHKQDRKGDYITDDKGNYIRVDETIPGKLVPKIVSGGCILKERPFQISI
jgi:hypothetical protein